MIRKRPYLLLLILIFVLLIYSLFRSNNNSLDVNIHDTYYVIREIDLLILVVSFISLLFLIYLMLDFIRIKMNLILSRIHIFSTLFLLFLFYVFYFKKQLPTSPDKYYIITDYPRDYNFFIIIVLLLVIFFQLLFIINIFVSIIKKMRTLCVSQ